MRGHMPNEEYVAAGVAGLVLAVGMIGQRLLKGSEVASKPPAMFVCQFAELQRAQLVEMRDGIRDLRADMRVLLDRTPR